MVLRTITPELRESLRPASAWSIVSGSLIDAMILCSVDTDDFHHLTVEDNLVSYRGPDMAVSMVG